MYNLINAPSLLLLEKEYLFYDHKLKYLSPVNMKHLIELGILLSYLNSIKVLPYLSCLLGKSKKKPWHSKAPIALIQKQLSKSGIAVLVDQLVSSTPGLKLQSTRWLIHVPIVEVQVFAKYSSSLPFLYVYS